MKKIFAISISLLFLIVASSCGLTNSNTRGSVVAPEDNSVASIKFDTIHTLMIVEGEVNGVKGRFLFDNGFTLSAVSPGFAEKCGIKFEQAAKVNDINNNKTVLAETTLESFKIGGYDFQKTGFYRVDTKKFFPCSEVDGVIGGSIINKTNWKIDYANRTIEISEDPFDFSESAVILPVTYNHGNSALTKITVKGEDITCKIDIGMSGEMAIKKKKYLPLFVGEEAVKSDGISSLGATGLSGIEYNYDIANRTTIASRKTELPIGTELELEQSQKYDGYIGIGYLRHYTVLLNSTRKQYVLTFPDKPKDHHRNYGISIYPINDTCRVIQKNGFDPLLNGVELMTVVSTIDGKPTSDFRSVCELRAFMRNKIKEKSELTLQFEGNEEPLVLPYREPVVGKIE